MNGKQLSITSAILMVIASVLVVISIFFPWWRMDFFAPQYPEGLEIIVYLGGVEGDLSNINALNHYIGMEEFSEESFPELQFLPYVIGGLALLILIGALLRKKAYLYFLLGLFAVGGIFGVIHLTNSLNKYSMNLDPMAPIDYPPFKIPIIGENVVANFNTISYLGLGIYFAIGAFILLVISLWKDRKK